MQQLILHHYPISPFAEKIRLILGFKGLHWSSVIIPNIMPKPDLIALTGGYRKTPMLQIGADIYCDTALIADVHRSAGAAAHAVSERRRGRIAHPRAMGGLHACFGPMIPLRHAAGGTCAYVQRRAARSHQGFRR